MEKMKLICFKILITNSFAFFKIQISFLFIILNIATVPQIYFTKFSLVKWQNFFGLNSRYVGLFDKSILENLN